MLYLFGYNYGELFDNKAKWNVWLYEKDREHDSSKERIAKRGIWVWIQHWQGFLQIRLGVKDHEVLLEEGWQAQGRFPRRSENGGRDEWQRKSQRVSEDPK